MIEYDEFTLENTILSIDEEIYVLGKVTLINLETRKANERGKFCHIYTVQNTSGVRYKIWDKSMDRIFSKALENHTNISILCPTHPKIRGKRLCTDNNTIIGLEISDTRPISGPLAPRAEGEKGEPPRADSSFARGRLAAFGRSTEGRGPIERSDSYEVYRALGNFFIVEVDGKVW